MKKMILATLGLMIIVACSRKITSTTSTAPRVTYAADVKSIIDTKCTPCHIPSQGGKVTSLDGYANARTNISEMIIRVQLDSTHAKFMPFKNKKPRLTETEIATLKNWQAGGLVQE